MTRQLFVGAFFAATAAVAASCATSQALPDCSEAGASATVCGAICVDVTSDPEHCGACGKACAATEVCTASKCVAQCPAGELLCAGDAGRSCVNAKTDNKNCGACGKTCKSTEACVGGGCSSSCPIGRTMCTPEGGAAFCTDLKTDNANCGKCGAPCGPTEACVGGICQGSCAPDQTLCGEDAGKPYCANLDSDNANCGDCGKKCGLLESCTAGACAPGCAPPQKTCTPDGGPAYCADTQSDNVNCGTCGNVCPPAKPVCAGGTCTDGSLYTFSGVQTNLPKAQLTGWSVCYQDTYNVTMNLPNVLAQCQGTYLLMGCMPNNAANLTVAAMGLRSDVTFATGNTAQGQNKVHVANGVEWYCDNNWSWGFANPGDAVNLFQCDVQTSPNNNLRLCWHTVGAGGYRCGATTGLNADATWTRVVYKAL